MSAILTREHLSELPDAPLPAGFSVRAMEGEQADERVYVTREYANDISFVTVRRDGESVAIVGMETRPTARERRASWYAARQALIDAANEGAFRACAVVAEHQSGAAKLLLDLGFEPEQGAAWDAVAAALAAYRAPDRAPIRLWPGDAPYLATSSNPAVPSLRPYRCAGSRGAMVICPGGGYTRKASHEGDQVAQRLNQAGISAFVLDYRVMPFTVDAPLSDAQRAIRLVRSMGYEKVGIMGFSAGGHLTASAGTLFDEGDAGSSDPVERLSCRPDAFAPCYAVTALDFFLSRVEVDKLFDGTGDHAAAMRRFAAAENVTERTPPAFLWHTANDPVVPVSNSLELAAALARASVPMEVHIFPNGAHGLGLAYGVEAVEIWPTLLCRWLTEQGFGTNETKQGA